MSVGAPAEVPSGEYSVIPLLDGNGTFPEPVTGAFPDASESALARAALLDPGAVSATGSWRLAFRCFAIRRAGIPHVVVVDTGIGGVRQPAAGWTPVPGSLTRRLAEAGIAPQSVGTVVLTHLHADHAGGILTDDDEPLFPTAKHFVQATELASVADDPSPRLRKALTCLAELDLLQTVHGPVDLDRHAHGSITVTPTPGHTPGHQSVLVTSAQGDVWITGDVLVNAVQLADPTVAYRYEDDRHVARASRLRLLDDARRRRASLATAHLGSPFVTVPPTVGEAQ